MYIVEFLKIAEIELDEIFVYYENEQENLGYRFINELNKSIAKIQLYPTTWIKLTSNTRRYLMKIFPYEIVYEIRKDKILIIAIANLYKKPKYWKDRIC